MYAFKLVPDFFETSGCDDYLAGLGMAEGVLDPTGLIALRRHHVELCQPPMFDGPRGLDELLCPHAGLVLFDPITKKRRVDGGRGCGIEIALVGDKGSSTCVLYPLDTRQVGAT